MGMLFWEWGFALRQLCRVEHYGMAAGAAAAVLEP